MFDHGGPMAESPLLWSRKSYGEVYATKSGPALGGGAAGAGGPPRPPRASAPAPSGAAPSPRPPRPRCPAAPGATSLSSVGRFLLTTYIVPLVGSTAVLPQLRRRCGRES